MHLDEVTSHSEDVQLFEPYNTSKTISPIEHILNETYCGAFIICFIKTTKQ